jgi:hypothetical protein
LHKVKFHPQKKMVTVVRMRIVAVAFQFISLIEILKFAYVTTTSPPSSQPSTQPTTQPTVRISSSLKNGLVAYYPFDGNANDNSGNGNHGDLHGGVTIVSDRFGNAQNAYLFDGSSGFISAPGQQFNFVYNMSFSVWIKYTTDLTPWLRVLDKCSFNNGNFQAGWSFEKFTSVPNQFYFASVSAPNSGDVTPLMTLVKNQWNHVVMTKKGLVIRMYLNGVLVNSTTTGTHPTIASNGNMPFLIGAACGSYTNPLVGLNSQFNGIIDDVFIFNRTLSEREVSLLYSFDSPTSQPSTQPTVRISSSLKNGLVAYYPFDGNADDNSGNGIHGIRHGGVSLMTDRFGFSNSAFSFDGNTGYIEFPSGALLNVLVNGTISFWINPGSVQHNYSTVFSKFNDNGGFVIAQDFYIRNHYSAVFYNQHQQRGLWDFIVIPNVWSHVVVLKNVNLVHFYVNGVKTVSGIDGLNSVTMSQNVNLPLIVGGHNYLGATFPVSSVVNFYTGGLDDIAIFNRSLSVKEIQMLYQSNVPTGQPSSQPSNQPSRQPTGKPTAQPSRQPSSRPSCQPTSQPSSQPSLQPTTQPTVRISASLKNGLVAYYPFDWNTNDNSGNGNHGILHGGVSLVADRFGNIKNAYSFDGSTGFIEVAGQPFNFAYNMSFSVWIKYSVDVAAWSRVFDKCTFNNGVFQAGWSFEKFDTYPDQFYFIYASTSSVSSWTPVLSLTKNQWNHVVLSKKGKIMRVYVNGALVVSVSSDNPSIASNGNLPFLIGAGCWSYTNPIGAAGSMFNGVIDDVFIYNRTLTDKEASLLYMFDSPTSQPSNQPTRQPSSQPSVQPSLQPSTQPTFRISSSLKNGLVAYYPFDGNADDNSGNGNHGMVHSATFVTDRSGNSHNAIHFNGIQSYVEIPGAQFNFQSNMSVSFWIKPSMAQAQWTVIFDKSVYESSGSVNVAGYQFIQTTTQSNAFAFLVCTSFNHMEGSDQQLTGNKWNHVVVTKMNNVLTFYVNGIDVKSVTIAHLNILTNDIYPLILGGQNRNQVYPAVTVANHFNGTLDDFFVFNRALNENEVHMLSGFDNPTSQPSKQPSSLPTVRISSSLRNGLVAYYPFDGNANDNSGNGNHGTLRGGVSLAVDRFGIAKNAFSFDGSTGFIEIPGQQLNFLNNMSISLWCYIESSQFGSWNKIIDKSMNSFPTYGNGQYLIHQSAERLGFYTFCLSSAIGVGDCHTDEPFQIPTSTWAHLTITKSDKFVKVFVNSNLVLTYSLATANIYSNGNSPLLVGASNLGGTSPASSVAHFFNGKLDDLFFWNRPLTVADVIALGQFDSPTSQPTGHFQNSMGSCLFSNQAIYPGKCLISPSRRYKFCFGVDGSGCVTKYSTGASWCAFGPHANPVSLAMQGDGNFVAYTLSEQPYFATNTEIKDFRIGRQTFVTIQDNGNLVIYNTTNAPPNRVAWQCATRPSNPCPVTSLATGTSIGELCSNQPTSQPSAQPSSQPTVQPTRQPLSLPTTQPTTQPSRQPSSRPTQQPTAHPSKQPTCTPSGQPSCQPVSKPTGQPSNQPSSQPNVQPTSQPTRKPSSQPSRQPSSQPTQQPTAQPSAQPASSPSGQPSTQPTNQPSSQPKEQPSGQPSRQPTSKPTGQPTSKPSNQPTCSPSNQPSTQPTIQPSNQPTIIPTFQPISPPSSQPTRFPTFQPVSQPSGLPISFPTVQPTLQPTSQPSEQPSSRPTDQPTIKPSMVPTSNPSIQPTAQPTSLPSNMPSRSPSSQPSCGPTNQPTGLPTFQPSAYPSSKPFPCPSGLPSSLPTQQPTSQPTQYPSSTPTTQPSAESTSQPSNCPTSQPTSYPTGKPLPDPSSLPASQPTELPSGNPSAVPSQQPSSHPSTQPNSTLPTRCPTGVPAVIPTGRPSSSPTGFPSSSPTISPTNVPTKKPIGSTSAVPTSHPTAEPTNSPSNQPTNRPTCLPVRKKTTAPVTSYPSSQPSRQPTGIPSCRPSFQPVSRPSGQPSRQPTSRPSRQPITHPTAQPSRQPTRQPSNQPTARPSSSQPTSIPTLASSAPTPVPAPSVSAAPSTTKRPTRMPTVKPTMKPSVSPTVSPTVTPTVTPSAVPTAAPTNALSVLPVGVSNNFRGTLFLLGTGSASSTPDTSNIYLSNFFASQRSFIIFGQEKDKVQSNFQIGSRESHGFYAEISSSSSSGTGMSRDSASRSITIVGDLNNDGFDDLVVGFPYASTCFVYLGSSAKGFFQNLMVSFAIYGLEEDEFGWSVSRAGDMNFDNYQEMIICAKIPGICYVFFGKPEFVNDIYIRDMTSSDGFRIIGSTSTTINFGMAVDSVGDFNNDGWNDLMISAMSFTTQGIVYIVLGRPVEKLK